MSKQRDYYKEIDDVLTSYEYYKSYHPHDMDWATNRIDWCWRWRKITEEQMKELADRATLIFEKGIF